MHHLVIQDHIGITALQCDMDDLAQVHTAKPGSTSFHVGKHHLPALEINAGQAVGIEPLAKVCEDRRLLFRKAGRDGQTDNAALYPDGFGCALWRWRWCAYFEFGFRLFFSAQLCRA